MAKKAFIYARRSSEKNRERSISIETQIETLVAECKKQGLEVAGIFKDNKSGFVAGKRDDFSRMLKEIRDRNVRKQGERVDCLFVYMASRLARNFEEEVILRDYVMDDVVEVLSVQERIDCSTLAGKKYLVEKMLDATFDSLEKSKHGTINMDMAYWGKGSLSGRLPRGYVKVGTGDRARVEIDTKYRINEAVVSCFQLYATGEHTYESLTAELNARGFVKYDALKTGDVVSPFTKKDVELILNNDFYWGRVVVKYRIKDRESMEHFVRRYPELKPSGKTLSVDYTERFQELGTFKPLVSRALFQKCANIREGKQAGPKGGWTDGDAYVWKGIVRCPCRLEPGQPFDAPGLSKTLRSFTAETKKKG